MRCCEWVDQQWKPRVSLIQAFGITLGETVCLVGGGGKTTLLFALADEWARSKRVLVSTTTHIMRPTDAVVATSAADARSLLQKHSLVVYGIPSAAGKLSSPPLEELLALRDAADLMLLEADGAKRHPLKVPREVEPVLPDWTSLVIAVGGLSALGHPVHEVVFRSELLDLPDELDQGVTPGWMAALLSSEWGQRKGVGNRRYVRVLSQADTPARLALAGQAVRAMTGRGAVFAVSASEEERNRGR